MSECKHSFNLNEGKFCKYCGINFDDLMRNIDVSNLEKERDELQAQVAVLRGALEEINKVSTEQGLSMLDGACKGDKLACEALDATPAEAAERVQRLVEALEGICAEFNDTETDICTTIQAMHDKAQEALSEWRRDKCS